METGLIYWQFYLSLDKEVKQDFMIEIQQRTQWGRSTFYTRMKGGPALSEAERDAIDKVYRKYKKMYG